MPFTPFLGISVLIHLFVIALHKLFERIPFKKAGPSYTTRSMHTLGFLIVAIVVLSVIVNATFIIRASIFSKNSSVNIISDIISNQYNNINPINTSGNIALAPVSITEEKVESTCKIINSEDINLEEESLIDFLKSVNLDYSFDFRKSLAGKFGIENYIGDVDQNFEILKKLKENPNNTCFSDKNMSILIQ